MSVGYILFCCIYVDLTLPEADGRKHIRPAGTVNKWGEMLATTSFGRECIAYDCQGRNP